MSEKERHILYNFTMWSLNKQTKQNKNKFLDTENRSMVTREGGGWEVSKRWKGVNCMVMIVIIC